MRPRRSASSHWGVVRHLRERVGASWLVVGLAILMDVVVLGGLLVVKLETDPLIVVVAGITIVTTYVAEGVFLRRGDANCRAMH